MEINLNCEGMKKRIFRTLTAILFVLVSNLIIGQIEIGEINLTVPITNTECSSLTLGETVTFTRSSNCGGDILITLNDVEVLNTPELSPSFTFSEAGRYVIFCGAGTDAVAVPKFCYIVNAPITVPTLGEWGIICLFLLISIIATVSFEVKHALKPL